MGNRGLWTKVTCASNYTLVPAAAPHVALHRRRVKIVIDSNGRTRRLCNATCDFAPLTCELDA